MTDVREMIRSFILENFASESDAATLLDDTDLKESGILNSFATLTLVSFIESRFGVPVELADLEAGRLNSVARIEELIASRCEVSP